MDLQTMRRWCRDHIDVDEEEYPNPLLDSYLEAGYSATLQIEQFWPFYRQRWALARQPGWVQINLPADVDKAAITDVNDVTTRTPLIPIDGFEYGSHPTGMSSEPIGYRVFGQTLEFWPPFPLPDGRLIEILGYRIPGAFPTSAGQVPDCDVRLHQAICYHAVSLMYLNQEDEVLSGIYMQRWEQAAEIARRAITRRSNPHVVMNGMMRVPTRRGAGIGF